MTSHLAGGHSAVAAMSTAEIKRHITEMFKDSSDVDVPDSRVAVQ